ncbi:uncharacterized protein [Nicotiana sylvestris]|uniref:uncharacterized protein n=1 Tax=Nicotiana sylvestris TaxID=4096 RepID=UPI00388C4B74
MKTVARSSELEASLKARVAGLTAELNAKAAEVERLKGELSVDTDKLAAAISGTASLESVLCVCRSELAEEKKASGRKVAGLEGRVKELEAELAALNGRMASLRAEDANHRSQPSTFCALTDLVVRRRLYELWVHAEARLDVYKAFHAEGRATEAELQDVTPKLVQLMSYDFVWSVPVCSQFSLIKVF